MTALPSGRRRQGEARARRQLRGDFKVPLIRCKRLFRDQEGKPKRSRVHISRASVRTSVTPQYTAADSRRKRPLAGCETGVRIQALLAAVIDLSERFASNLQLPRTLTAVKFLICAVEWRKRMGRLERFGYRFNPRQLGIAALFLALAFVAARVVFRDSLALGYGMVIPSYVFLSFVIEAARMGKGSFWDIRGWAETAIAVAGSVGVGYIGFKLWSVGY